MHRCVWDLYVLANPIAFWLNCAIWSQPWWLEVYAVVRPVEDWSQLPRIAIHHGIWRELMFSIRKSSTELNNASELRWHFPSALSPEAHAEWGLYKILEHMGLHEILPPGSGKNRDKLRKDIEEYHTAYAIDFDDADIGPVQKQGS